MAAAADDEVFHNLDGSLDDVVEGQDDSGKQANAEDVEIDEGFADLLSAADEIVVPGDDPEASTVAGREAAAVPVQADESQQVDEDPDDENRLSEDMKRRLLRAKRIAEADAEQRLRAEFDTQMTQVRSENEQLRQRLAQPAGAQPSQNGEPAELTQARDKLKEAKERRRKAKLEGDVDAEEAADEDVRALDFDVRRMELIVRAARQQQQQPNTGAQPTSAQPQGQAPQQQPQAPARTPHANASAWIDRNKAWFNQPGHEEATQKAAEIDRDLWAKGYRPEDADYFTELDRRLKKAGVKKPSEAAAANTANGGGSHVAPANGGSGQTRNASAGGQTRAADTGGRVRLSSDEVRMMKSLKLDPTNPRVVAEWRRNG